MLKKTIKVILLIGFNQLNYTSSNYFAGTLDTTFNSTGTQPGTLQSYINDQSSNPSRINNLLIQTDGKIVASGYTFSDDFEFAIARFNYNGSFDTTFNADGDQPGTLTLSNLGGNTTNNQIWGGVLQDDGKILVAGQTNDTAVSSLAMALARFNPNGSLDTTFNTTGANPGTVVINNINGDTQQNYAYQVTLQADHKIVVAGASNQSFGIARLNPDGSLDTSFNATGINPGTFSLNTFDGTSDISICHSVALQTDQKIVMAGTHGTSIALARLNIDGSLDTTFNADGVQPGTTTISNIDGNTSNNGARTVLIQADGKIVVIGSSEVSPRYRSILIVAVALARFNSNGSLDTTFNTGGTNPGTVAIYNVNGNTTENTGLDAKLQSDQKIVIAAGLLSSIRSPSEPETFGIIRVNPDGSLDTTFNPNGGVPGTASTTVCENETSQPNAIAIQNTSLVLAGYTLNTDFDIDEFALARFLGTTISSTSNLFAVRLIEKYGNLI